MSAKRFSYQLIISVGLVCSGYSWGMMLGMLLFGATLADLIYVEKFD